METVQQQSMFDLVKTSASKMLKVSAISRVLQNKRNSHTIK